MKFEFERQADIKRLRFITDNLLKHLYKDANILDVGCGNGIISRHLADVGFNVLGIDVSKKAILKAKSIKESYNLKFEVKDANELAESKFKYKGIVCSEVLEHLENPKLFLNSIYKLLDQDGILIITVPNGFGPREVLITKPMQFISSENTRLSTVIRGLKKSLGYSGETIQSSADDLSHIQFFSLADFKHLASDTNFEIIKMGKTDFLEEVFPFSLFARRVIFLQKIDCAIADILPLSLNGGFFSVWKKSNK